MYTKTYSIKNLKGKPVKLTLNVWDTPGGDEFAHMRDLDYEGADACIMVYCIDKETTFNEMPEIKQLADTHCKPPPLYFLVGNKVDLEREGRRAVEDEDGKDFKKEEKLTSIGHGYVNSGLYHLLPEVFDGFEVGSNFSIETDVFPRLLASRQLGAIKLTESFIDIGVPEDYLKFCKWVKLGKINGY